jgi:hypothetical protein
VDYAVEAKTERISAELKSAVDASTDPHGRGPRRRSPPRAGRLTLDTGICGSEGVWGQAEQQQQSGHFGGNSTAGWRILTFLYPATSLYRIFSYTIPMVIAAHAPSRILLPSVYSLVFSAAVGF